MFYDTMGLEIGVKDGVHPDDMNNALRGHLPNGYKVKTKHLNLT